MKIYYLKAWLFIGIIILAAVSCKTSKTAADKDDKMLENSLLWEISGNDLTNESYLFGTIHIIHADDYFLPEGTLTALDQSEKIVFEIDMNDMTDITKQLSLLKDAFMKDGLSLKDLLNTEEYQLVKDHFNKIGIPLFLFERMKPMFLTVFASGEMNPSDFQTGKIKSYEMEFLDIANRTSKETGGLETIEYQLSVFDSIPYTEQAKMLIESIKSNDTEGDQFRQMIEIYKQQDLNAMMLMMKEDESIENYNELLLTNRNKSWIPIMEEMMRDHVTFFAVGAGHLGGSLGIIRLLRAQGYVVKPFRVRQI